MLFTRCFMPATSKRATLYFDPKLYQALRLKAVESEKSVSALVSEALRGYLSEDAEDLSAIDKRAKEPSVSFESFVKKLKRDGKL